MVTPESRPTWYDDVRIFWTKSVADNHDHAVTDDDRTHSLTRKDGTSPRRVR
jgi:hypothetical protein